MGISFRQAIRKDTQLLIGLAGPSSAGKSYSALTIATGMREVLGGEIFGIDTENGRLAHYAGEFDFQHGAMAPPFSPSAYLDAIQTARKAGARIIIVDSASHMHEGVGGVIDMHEAELQRRAGDDFRKREAVKFSCWIKPKAEVNRFVNTILQIDAHFIFCFRAKEKLKMVKNQNGKNEPVPMGWTPIITDRFDYEMTATLILPPGSEGKPDPQAESTKLPRMLHNVVPAGAQLSRQIGRDLAEWARGDEPSQVTRQGTSKNTNQARRPPTSHGGAPDREVPSDDPPVDGGASHLFGYHRELAGAKDGDDLAARQEGSEHFHQLDDGERQKAREIYKLHLRRVRGQLPAEAVAAEIELLLEGVPA